MQKHKNWREAEEQEHGRCWRRSRGRGRWSPIGKEGAGEGHGQEVEQEEDAMEEHEEEPVRSEKGKEQERQQKQG